MARGAERSGTAADGWIIWRKRVTEADQSLTPRTFENQLGSGVPLKPLSGTPESVPSVPGPEEPAAEPSSRAGSLTLANC